ncbi:MAG: hypothetical protein RDV41_13830 [Planctomycetota bacterium]|nr:hypothetical protein [Planctomycetota bacterium]
MTTQENSDLPQQCLRVRNNLALLDRDEASTLPECRSSLDHLSTCPQCREWLALEEAFEHGLVRNIARPGPDDEGIWQRAFQGAMGRALKDAARTRLRRLVSFAAAAVILVGVIAAFLFRPQGGAESLLHAMEHEHESFVNGQAKMETAFESPKQLSAYLRKNGLLGPDECCCALFKSDSTIRPRGCRIGPVGETQRVGMIHAYRGETPITFFVYGPHGACELSQDGTCRWAKSVGSEDLTATLKCLTRCTIGAVSRMSLENMGCIMEKIRSLKCAGCGCGCADGEGK